MAQKNKINRKQFVTLNNDFDIFVSAHGSQWTGHYKFAWRTEAFCVTEKGGDRSLFDTPLDAFKAATGQLLNTLNSRIVSETVSIEADEVFAAFKPVKKKER